MKKYLYIFFALLSVLFLYGCSETGVPPVENDEMEEVVISGKIYRIEDNRILVISGLETVNVPWVTWFENGNRAVFFSINDSTRLEYDGQEILLEDIKRGQAVDVYPDDFLAQSYPEQGAALKVVVQDQSSEGEEYTDSGRFIGMNDGNLLELHVSGVPEELESREYRLTKESKSVAESMNLQIDEVILIRYIDDSQSSGLIFDLERINN